MNQSKTPLVASIAAIIVAVVAMFVGTVHAPTASNVQTPAPRAGALTGPEIPSPYLQWGGVTRWGASQASYTASSTLCAMQSPAATSTLKGITVIFKTNPGYVQTYMIGYSTTMSATTTGIVSTYTVAANALGNIVATTTATALSGINVDGVVSPNSWINVNLSTSTALVLTNTATAQCTATWDQL